MNLKSLKIIAIGLSIAAVTLLNSGCASSAARVPGVVTGYAMSAQNPVRAVSVDIREGVKDTIRFDQEKLREAIIVELKNNSLYQESPGMAAPALEVEVTKIRVRSTFNAVMWGAMSGNDSIHGDVVIRDAQGKQLDQLTVKTSYALGGFAGGQDGMRMNWLYEAFAKEIAEVYMKFEMASR